VPPVPLREQPAGVGEVLVGEPVDLQAGHAVTIGTQFGSGTCFSVATVLTLGR
jgi:hypothetical protein